MNAGGGEISIEQYDVDFAWAVDAERAGQRGAKRIPACLTQSRQAAKIETLALREDGAVG